MKFNQSMLYIIYITLSPSLPDEIQANNRLKHEIKCVTDNLPISSDSVQRKAAQVVKHVSVSSSDTM